jgi:hypothetical protein
VSVERVQCGGCGQYLACEVVYEPGSQTTTAILLDHHECRPEPRESDPPEPSQA